MLLYIIGIPLIALTAILSLRAFAMSRGEIVEKEDGLIELQKNTEELYRFLIRVWKHIRKHFEQYLFHIVVRSLHHFRNFSHSLYAYARKRFMKTVIQDKRAVSRFWEHLKEYKQEIEKERSE